MAVEAKDVLGERYRVVRPLEGGSGKWVYLVQDLRQPRRSCVLIEIIDRITDAVERQAAIRAFEREVDTLAALKCVHLPRIHTRFSEGFRHYLVTEFVEGVSLEKRRRRMGGRLDEALVIDISLQILDALEELHGCNPAIIYGGLAPSKVMLDKDGSIKLVDLPVERHFQAPGVEMAARVGGFAPPEMYRGMLEERSDLYAIGALMHYLLSGYRPPAAAPFLYANPAARPSFYPTVDDDTEPPRKSAEPPPATSVPPLSVLSPQCNPGLVELINHALAPEVETRIASTREFKYRLQQIKNKPWTPPAAHQTRVGVSARDADPPAAGDDANSVVDPRDLEQKLRELTTRLVGEAIGAAIPTMACPHCGRRIAFDASFCAYCGETIAGRQALPSPAAAPATIIKPVPVGPRWPALLMAVVVLGLMFAASSYYVGNRLVRQLALTVARSAPQAPVKPAVTAAPIPTPAKLSADQEALRTQLKQDIARLKALPAGDPGEADLREDIIFTAARMKPAPPIAPQAQELLDRGEAEVRIATSDSDYRKAAEKLDKALRIAPWVAAGYLAMAQAQAGAGNTSQAIASYKDYLLAPPPGANTEAIRAAMLKLEPQPATANRPQESQETAQLPLTGAQSAPNMAKAAPAGPDLNGTWYRRKAGATGHLSSQRVRISRNGDRITVRIIADCGNDACLPDSDSWKPHHRDPNNPVPEYAGQYLLDGQTMTSGPIQWSLPGEDGDCRIISRRIGDISRNGREIVIRTSDSGDKCRMYESDVRLWRP